jgi:hypothetical protein
MMNTGEGESDLTPPDGCPGWQDLGRTYLKIGAIGFGGGYTGMKWADDYNDIGHPHKLCH